MRKGPLYMMKFGNSAGDVITLHRASNRYLMSDMLPVHTQKNHQSQSSVIILPYNARPSLGFLIKCIPLSKSPTSIWKD